MPLTLKTAPNFGKLDGHTALGLCVSMLVKLSLKFETFVSNFENLVCKISQTVF